MHDTCRSQETADLRVFYKSKKGVKMDWEEILGIIILLLFIKWLFAPQINNSSNRRNRNNNNTDEDGISFDDNSSSDGGGSD